MKPDVPSQERPVLFCLLWHMQIRVKKNHPIVHQVILWWG